MSKKIVKHRRNASRTTVWMRALSGTAVALALSACGGGASETAAPPLVVATADTLSLTAGQTGSLIANDRLGSANATVGATGNLTFSVASSTLPSGVTVTDGVVTVAESSAPGAYTLTYKLCEANNASNCASGSAAITIAPLPIVAIADSFTLVSGASGDLLINDTLGGTAASGARVAASATATLPTGITLSTAGVISVSSSAAAGSYSIGYRICQVSVASNCASSTVTVVVPAMGTLSGRAIDASTALGVSGVRVSVGDQSTTTDSNGNFNLIGLAVNARAVVLFTSTTYVQSARITSVAEGISDVQARLVRVGTTATVPIAGGGVVSVAGSTAQVVLPSAGVQRADGSIPTGDMQVRLTPINPATDASVMPGDFTTIASGSATPIESFGALNVTLTDSAGSALNLRTGQTATIRIPVASRGGSSMPATIPLFHFDNASGRWMEEGSATLAGTAPNQYYQGSVSHFSTWNADRAYDTIRLTGCLADVLGNRIAGAQVQSDGVDYSGTSSTTTDSAGNFSIAIKKNSTATIVGLSSGRLTNTLRAGPYAADAVLSASCLALGQNGAGVTMKLTWGDLPRDLDSHLYTPNGFHLYFANKGNLLSAPFANLDVDDISSYGPEVVTITKLMVGTYKYAVKNYSGQSSGLFSASGGRVELNVPGRSSELFTVPNVGETGFTNWWLLFEFDVDASCNITVRRSSTYSTTEPSLPSSSTPVYCTRP